MPLTAIAAKEAKPKDKPYKLSDEKGLYLLINPKGAKYWRLKYRYGGKEKTLALGVYPEVSLAWCNPHRQLVLSEMNMVCHFAVVSGKVASTQTLSIMVILTTPNAKRMERNSA